MSQIRHHNDIFDYIVSEEANYRRPIPINETWNWSMKEHIKLSDLYKHSQLSTGKDDFKPVKNITRPILNLQYRTEDLEVKDIQIYVDNPEKFHLSFLVKKYHDDVFVQENDIDTYIDELNVSRIDFGAGLSKKLNKPAPEVVPLQSIAFCDQTDMLSGPIGIKHYFSPDQLLEMGKFGWGDMKNNATITLKDLISLSREEKRDNNTNDKVAKTPGRYIEIYEVHGNLPKKFMKSGDSSDEYESSIYICAFYQKKTGDGKEGVILYAASEKESPFKLVKRDSVYGRALGFGGAEELFESQVWVNYDMIRMQAMLDAASKTILKVSGSGSATITNRQNIRDLDNLAMVDVGEDGDISQVDTYPRNIKLFDSSIAQWEAHAQQMGAANDAILGESPASGTPFKLQELVTAESHGLHEYRRGQFAKHIEEVYKDWIIPHIQKKITEGSEFLSELSLDELQWVAERVAIVESNKRIKQMVFDGKMVTPEEQKTLIETIKQGFKEGGSEKFIKLLRGEFRNEPLSVKVSVAGKSKNLSQRTDKLVNVFRQVISNPAVLRIPAIAGIFNDILESSGLSPADFGSITKEDVAQTQPTQEGVPAPQLEALAGTNG